MSVGLSLARPLSIAALVLSLAFAGCAGGDDEDDHAGSESQTSTAPSLVAVIRLGVDGNETGPVPSGAPFYVAAGAEVTFDGSGSSGAIVSYAWDFGDNATGSDETETHAYAAGGTYDVTLTVTGLGNATANATATIEVAADTTGELVGREAFTFEGDLPLANPNSCTNQDVDCRDHVVAVGAVLNGTDAIANNVTIVLNGEGTTAVHMQMFWRSPDGTVLAQTTAEGLDHTLTYTGDMPAGDYVVRVRLFVGAQASYTIVGAVDYVST